MSIAVKSLTRTYGAVRALDDVSLAATPGEILAICGENGAGKSTLMAILAGASPVGTYNGVVELDGQPVTFAGPREAEQRGVTLLPQELLYYPELSVAENLMLGRLPTRAGILDRRGLARRAAELLAVVGLDVDPLRPMRTLAVSDRQLVCIARALAQDPRVLILDEPTAVLPRHAADRLFAVLRRLAHAGTTVLYVSHHLSEVTKIADRVAVLRNGRVALAPTAGVDTATIVAAMSGDVPEAVRNGRTRASGGDVLDIAVGQLRRGPETVVSDLAVSVGSGEIVGLAGLAGSGRDDLIEAIAGSRAHRLVGTMTLARRPLPRRAHRARRAGLAFVPAERRSEGLMMLDSVMHNLFLGAEERSSVAGWRRKAAERRDARGLIARFDVRPPTLDRRVGQLSGGNQQKVLVARAMGRGARCVVLAEPTRGVDVTARASIHSLLFAAADAGAALLISSSDTDELLAICDRIVVLHEGRCVAQVSTSEIDTPTLLHLVTAGAEALGRRAKRQGDGPPTDAAHPEKSTA